MHLFSLIMLAFCITIWVMGPRKSRMGKQVHAVLTSCQDVILDSINEGVFTVDSDWRITSFNRAAQKITGIKRKDAIGHHCNEVFRASICENNCAIKKALTTGGGDREFERSHHQRDR